MEVYFNELSFGEDSHELVYDDVVRLRDIHYGLSHFDIPVCRISSGDYNRLLDKISYIPSASNIKNFIYGFFRAPYESSDNVISQSDEYLEHRWRYKTAECFGLAWGYILDTLVLSLYSEEWDKTEVEIFRDELSVNVRHFCDAKHLECHREWYESKQEVKLLVCGVLPEDKHISLRDDHGKDILLGFGKRLLQNEYVYGIVNSLPFNPHVHRFIKDIKEDGLIEIVLPWTDEGLGLVVKTTGRNKRETKAIAKILEEKYGYL